LINIDRDGIDTIISNHNHLVFYDFDSLGEVAKYDLDANLSAADFQIFLTKKIAQVANFSQSKQNQIIKKFFLFSFLPTIQDGLSKNIVSMFNLIPLGLTNHNLVKNPQE